MCHALLPLFEDGEFNEAPHTWAPHENECLFKDSLFVRFSQRWKNQRKCRCYDSVTIYPPVAVRPAHALDKAASQLISRPTEPFPPLSQPARALLRLYVPITFCLHPNSFPAITGARRAGGGPYLNSEGRSHCIVWYLPRHNPI